MTTENINLMEMFRETHDEIIAATKKNNGIISKHFVQQRYNELVKFTDNPTYRLVSI
jgi:hypothetical protein